MRDLVIEVDELGKRLAHDEVGSSLYRSFDSLDVVYVLEELAACLVVAAYDVAGTGIAFFSQGDHGTCNVSNVYECASAALKRCRAVLKIAVQDFVYLIVFGISGTDYKCREHHYGIEPVECDLLHYVSSRLSLGFCIFALDLVAVEVDRDILALDLRIQGICRAQVYKPSDLALKTHVNNVLGTDYIDSPHSKVRGIRE